MLADEASPVAAVVAQASPAAAAVAQASLAAAVVASYFVVENAGVGSAERIAAVVSESYSETQRRSAYESLTDGLYYLES